MHTNTANDMTDSSKTFWEKKYAAMTSPPSGEPSAVLRRFATPRYSGTALDLGCARGDDAIWLAQQGWRVTGIDISSNALETARTASRAAGVADRTSFICRDLSVDFSDDVYNLVSAVFLHSPMKFDRVNVLRRASASVAHGGLFLVASHGSRPPWSWAPEDSTFPSAEEELAELNMPTEKWQRIFVGPLSRLAQGPGGQSAPVLDNIIALERL